MRAFVVALSLTAAPPAAWGAASSGAPPPLPMVVAAYEHDLSTATGVVALNWPSIAYDRTRSEAYVVAEGFVRIFNSAGMEVHRFGDDGAIGSASRVAVLDDGNIVALTTIDGVRAYLRCDYRGEPIVRFGLAGLPATLDDFQPDQLVSRNGKLYFAESGRMRVVVTDPDGTYRQSYQIAALMAAAVKADPERKPATGLDGFGVDSKGNLLFTMSVLFSAGVVSPSGEVRLFGARGSTPGRFNNVGGIDADEVGNIYVTDRLRAVVSVWSPDLRHLGEFGYRGYGPTNLITPFEIAVGNGHVLVAQAGKRGVKAYRVELVMPPEPPQKPPEEPPQRPPEKPREKPRPVPPPAPAPAPAPPPPVATVAISDRDGDGVPDSEDQCPDQFGPPPDGCPPKKYTLIEVKKERIDLKEQIHFAAAKFRVLPDSFGLLDQVVQVLNDYPSMRISIEGHTDNVGGELANLTLSKRRAEAVRDYLVTKGISPARLEAVGYGPTKPITSNKTPRGKAKNRRTELRVVE